MIQDDHITRPSRACSLGTNSCNEVYPEPVQCNPSEFCVAQHIRLYSEDSLHEFADSQRQLTAREDTVLRKAMLRSSKVINESAMEVAEEYSPSKYGGISDSIIGISKECARLRAELKQTKEVLEAVSKVLSQPREIMQSYEAKAEDATMEGFSQSHLADQVNNFTRTVYRMGFESGWYIRETVLAPAIPLVGECLMVVNPKRT